MPHKISLADWLKDIEQSHARFVEPNPEHFQNTAKQLDVNRFSCPVISVAGTNGKGSCVALLSAIYQAAGFRVGSYTSPHLLRFNERAQIAGVALSDAEWVSAFKFISHAVDTKTFSYFEFITLAALYPFQQAKLDVLILEVGMGGRLDAVNCVDADCVIITNISLDHAHILGTDRDSIGREKAGIMRKSQPVIYGEKDIPVSLVEVAKKIGARLFCVGDDFNYQQTEHDWAWRSGTTTLEKLPLPQLLIANAATVLMAIEQLSQQLPVTRRAIERGISETHLPGRRQCLADPCQLILDVAHNQAAVVELANYLSLHPIAGSNFAVVGFMQDKDIQTICQPMMAQIDSWYCADLTTSRSADRFRIAQILQAEGAGQCYNHAAMDEALADAERACGPNDRIVVFGSFYTVAAAMNYWHIT